MLYKNKIPLSLIKIKLNSLVQFLFLLRQYGTDGLCTIRNKQLIYFLHKPELCLTLKKDNVLLPSITPYLILLCFAKSSILPISTSIPSLAMKAAKLVLYEATKIKAKNHKRPAANRVEIALTDIKKHQILYS